MNLNEHGSANGGAEESKATMARNSRYGLILFFIYLAFYATYVLITAFRPDIMRQMPIPGLNVAILFGFSLIGTAFVLALFYGWLCRDEAGSGDVSQGSRP